VKVFNRGRGDGYVVVQFILILAIMVVPAVPPAWGEPFATIGRVVGAALTVIGLLLGGVAFLQLGNNLTVFPKPKEGGWLVQNGAYAIVRHPIYTAVVSGAVGLSLFNQNLPSLILSLGLLVWFDLKSRYEESLLAAKYPDYAAYRARVKKLIPFIY
jgi:protein-S-isoprenylcysteine O-methyltransferase Ste14